MSISLSQGLFGDCLDVIQVASGDVVPVICSIIIPSSIEVGSQPDFSFTLSGDGISLVEGTSLLVAESRGVDWKITGLSTIDDSGSGTIQVRLTNTGNVQLSHRLELQTTEGLTASLVEEDIVNMVAGDSQQFTVVVTGLASGSQQITFQLTGTQEVSPPATTVDIDVTASFSESASNSQTLLYSSIAITLLAVILLGGHFSPFKERIRRRFSGTKSPSFNCSTTCGHLLVMSWSNHRTNARMPWLWRTISYKRY